LLGHVVPAIAGCLRFVVHVASFVPAGTASIVGHMAVASEAQWQRLFAARTSADVGEGIAGILALLSVPDLISFAGGFPDPLTFPRERASALLAEFAEVGEASAFQYAPTRGLHGPLDALAGRLEARQGRRPAEDEL